VTIQSLLFSTQFNLKKPLSTRKMNSTSSSMDIDMNNLGLAANVNSPLSNSQAQSPALSETSLKYRNTLTHSSQLLNKLREEIGKGDNGFDEESVYLCSKKDGGFLSSIDPDSEAAQIAKKKDHYLRFSPPVSSYNSIRETQSINMKNHRATSSNNTTLIGVFLIVFYEIHALWTSLWRLLRTKKLKVIFMFVASILIFQDC
jgi:hypothetical protein